MIIKQGNEIIMKNKLKKTKHLMRYQIIRCITLMELRID